MTISADRPLIMGQLQDTKSVEGRHDLSPQTRKIVLQDFDIPCDIGFHAHEIGSPQRLRVVVEIWLDSSHFPVCDSVDQAWDYDWLRIQILRLTSARRFNLQETVAREIYDLVASRGGVSALRVTTSKPDIYPDCAGVGVELASF